MPHPYGFTDALFEAANLEARRRSAALRQNIGKVFEPATFGSGGAPRSKLDEIESYLGHSLPEDLAYLAQHTLDPNGLALRWLQGPAAIEEFEDWVRQGLLFDIEQAALWLADWGPRPESPAERLELFEAEFESWPKLLPLDGHRAIPASPVEAGNPVFSVMQSDIIYYGTTLADWMSLDLTLDGRGDYAKHNAVEHVRHIPIWSDFAEGTEGFLAAPHRSAKEQERAWKEITALFSPPRKN